MTMLTESETLTSRNGDWSVENCKPGWKLHCVVCVAQWQRHGKGTKLSMDVRRVTQNVSVDAVTGDLLRRRHHHHHQSQRHDGRYYYTSTLTLGSSVTDDTGVYVCSATNGHGFVERRAFLHVIPAGAWISAITGIMILLTQSSVALYWDRCYGFLQTRMYLSSHQLAAAFNDTTLCLKKGPTLKLSVTLSNLNRFSKFLHFWKAYKIRYKTNTKLPTSP